MDFVYLMLNDKGETEPVQLLNASGLPQPLDANDPLVAKLNTGPGNGQPIQLRNERGEFVEAMQLTEYHYFVDENNKVIPIPPGSIVQGEFEDEVETDGVNHEHQGNDQSASDAWHVSDEDVSVVGETKLNTAGIKLGIEKRSVPGRVDVQDPVAVSEAVQSNMAEGPGSYEELNFQEGQGTGSTDEIGELGLENASETIFTQDEIELEEEVVSLQISEPELVTPRPSGKSKRSSSFTGYHDITSSNVRDSQKNADAMTVGEMQVKSPSRRSKKKQTSLVLESSSEAPQTGFTEKVSLQPNKKSLPSGSDQCSPSTVESSVTDTGRPKRSVPRRSALEMLHGDGKASYRKHATSSGSDSEVDVGSASQVSGKRRLYKTSEKQMKTLGTEKHSKASPWLLKSESKDESSSSQSLLTLPTVQSLSSDQKADDGVESKLVVTTATTNMPLPTSSTKRGKGRPRKVPLGTSQPVDNIQSNTGVQKDSASVSCSTVAELGYGSAHQDVVSMSTSEILAHTELVVPSGVTAATADFELSPSFPEMPLATCDAKQNSESAFVDVVEEHEGTTLEELHADGGATDHKTKASALVSKKRSRRGKGKRKMSGERKNVLGNKYDETEKSSSEREATIYEGLMENKSEMDVCVSSEHLHGSQDLGEESSELAKSNVSVEMLEESWCDEVPHEMASDKEVVKSVDDCVNVDSLALDKYASGVQEECEIIPSVLEKRNFTPTLLEKGEIDIMLQDEHKPDIEANEDCTAEVKVDSEVLEECKTGSPISEDTICEMSSKCSEITAISPDWKAKDGESKHDRKLRKVKKEKSTDCDSALIPLLCVHG